MFESVQRMHMWSIYIPISYDVVEALLRRVYCEMDFWNKSIKDSNQ